MLTLLLGGARSGKSSLAVELAARSGAAVTYVATSPRIDGDADLDARIDAHRAERPSHWRTDEEQLDLSGALERAGDDLVVVDCLTLWVSNATWHGWDDRTVLAAARTSADRAAQRAADTIVISNEVGMGVHPSTGAGREYRDLLGRVNQIWSRAADRAVLLVAGRVLDLLDTSEVWR